MLATERAPLSEILLRLFSRRVTEELGRGLVRDYRSKEDELRLLRGRLDVGAFARAMVRRPGHFPCRFDDHTVDTTLLRLIRATCRVVASQTRSERTRATLERVDASLEGVGERTLTRSFADSVTVDRRNERFGDIVDFCRLVAHGLRPSTRSGDVQSFSLLFPAERVFEGFLEGFFATEVLTAFPVVRMVAQGKSLSRFLVRDATTGRRSLHLEPDLLFELRGGDDVLRVVADAKWKRPNLKGGRPSRDVLYQLFAYSDRFDAPVALGLYPKAYNSQEGNFDFEGRAGGIRVRYVDLGLNLAEPRDRAVLAEDLRRELVNAFAAAAAVNAGAAGAPLARRAM